jgi:hypothetical protein
MKVQGNSFGERELPARGVSARDIERRDKKESPLFLS